MLVLSGRDIRACFTMDDAIDAAEEALAAVSAGATQTPLRTVVPVPGAGGSLISMPGHVAAPGGGPGALGVKVLGSFEGNLARDLPVTSAVMVVLDAETGVPQAVLDGTYLTRLRTGAASGAATRLLARTDARVGALVGAGGQAACQLEAMLAARRLDEVRIFDVRPGAAARLAERLAEATGVTLVVADDVRSCVEGADVVTTVTTAREPVLEAGWVAPGAHVNAVGSYTPEMHELPGELLAAASVLALDSRDAVLAEDGELIDAVAAGLVDLSRTCELGEVVLGRAPGRAGAGDLTVFKTVGMAAEDVVTARRVVDAALERGVGTEVALWDEEG